MKQPLHLGVALSLRPRVNSPRQWQFATFQTGGYEPHRGGEFADSSRTSMQVRLLLGASTTGATQTNMTIMQQPGAFTNDSSRATAQVTRPLAGAAEMAERPRSSSVYPFAVMQRLMGEMERRMAGALSGSIDYDSFQGVFEQVRWSPDLEVFTRGDDLVLRASLPGVSPEDWKVQLEDGVLSICGERRAVSCDGRHGIWYSESGNEQFIRRLTIPAHVREDDIRCTFDQGLLEISFPGV